MGFSLQSNGKGGYPSGGTLTLYHHLPLSPVIQGLYEFFFSMVGDVGVGRVGWGEIGSVILLEAAGQLR